MTSTQPPDNTIRGTAQPDLPVVATIECPSVECHTLETVAASDGTFVLDFTSVVDWESSAYFNIAQWIASYAAMSINDSPELEILDWTVNRDREVSPAGPFRKERSAVPFHTE
jgi:hypothetical protein